MDFAGFFCLEKTFIFAVQNNTLKFEIMRTREKVQNYEVRRTRAETPENLSSVGKWMMENPNGIAVIVNRRAVNR